MYKFIQEMSKADWVLAVLAFLAGLDLGKVQSFHDFANNNFLLMAVPLITMRVVCLFLSFFLAET
jgi:predicted Mrr-cat superfamily restriction endonuclease